MLPAGHLQQHHCSIATTINPCRKGSLLLIHVHKALGACLVRSGWEPTALEARQ